MQAPLSKWLPRCIVCCSALVQQRCLQAGYDAKKLVVIENGIDTDVFTPQLQAGAQLRSQLDISKDALLIGMVAEYTSIKRHDHFLDAAKLFLKQFPDTQFLLCGKNADSNNAALAKKLSALGIAENFHLLGIRDDMPEIYNALDINTLVSASESFGFAVIEAMACGTLNVATDTSMFKELLAGVGRVIDVTDDPAQLVQAWAQLAALSPQDKNRMLQKGQKRSARYAIQKAAEAYDALYSELACLV